MKNFYIDINAETLGDVLAFTHYMFQKTLGIGKQSEFLEGNYNLSDRLGYYGIIQTPMSLSEEYQRLKDRFTLITKENLDFIEEAKRLPVNASLVIQGFLSANLKQKFYCPYSSCQNILTTTLS